MKALNNGCEFEDIDEGDAHDRARELVGMPARTNTGRSGAMQQADPAVGADAVVELAAKAETAGEKTAALAAWRALSPDARAVTRKAVGKALGMNMAEMHGPKGTGAEDEQELVREHIPHPVPVDGDELLEEITETVKRYLVLPEHAAEAIALWCIQTHGRAKGCFDYAGYLAVSSPQPQCGKSTLLELIEQIAAKPLLSSGASAAALFRTIEIASPTMILDEMDQTFADPKANSDLIGTINAGIRRGAKVIRCVGDDHAPRKFNCFASYCLAGIKELPETIRSRAIPIRMQRKPPDKKPARRGKKTFPSLWRLGEYAARWVDDHTGELSTADEVAPRPESLSDRACDVWGPLFAVAAVAGGQWPLRAEMAALALSGSSPSDTTDIGEELLTDLHAVFAEDGRQAIPTEYILVQLGKMPDRPWLKWKRGESLDGRGLAKMLKPYEVFSKTVQGADRRCKGYDRESLEAAWRAYVPAVIVAKDDFGRLPAHSVRSEVRRAFNSGNLDDSYAFGTDERTERKSQQTQRSMLNGPTNGNNHPKAVPVTVGDDGFMDAEPPMPEPRAFPRRGRL